MTATKLSRDCRSALHYACASGNAAAAAALLDAGANPNVCTKEGNTPLHVAAFLGHGECVRVLVRRAPESVAFADRGGRVALHFASVRGLTAPPPVTIVQLFQPYPTLHEDLALNTRRADAACSAAV